MSDKSYVIRNWEALGLRHQPRIEWGEIAGQWWTRDVNANRTKYFFKRLEQAKREVRKQLPVEPSKHINWEQEK